MSSGMQPKPINYTHHKAASHCRTIFYHRGNMMSSCQSLQIEKHLNCIWDISKLGCTLDKQNFTWLMSVYFNKEQIDILTQTNQNFFPENLTIST